MEIRRALKFGRLANKIKEEEVETRAKYLETLEVDQVTILADKYMRDFMRACPDFPLFDEGDQLPGEKLLPC